MARGSRSSMPGVEYERSSHKQAKVCVRPSMASRLMGETYASDMPVLGVESGHYWTSVASERELAA